jgi:hypothetical protein
VAKLVGRLAFAGATLGHARRQAVRGFRQGLAEYGVPAEAVAELCEAYPGLNLLRYLRSPDATG